LVSRLGRFKNRIVPCVAAALVSLLALWLWLAPSEARLGGVIKVVYIHGALVWVGLLTFSMAGVLGLIALLARRAVWYRGTEAAGLAALLVWIAYVISSMMVTALAWGQLVAWNEPRVRVTGLIFVASVAIFLVSRLVNQREFTAAANVVMGIAPWLAVHRAEAVRHPIDAIGSSGSNAIQGYYLLIVLTVAALAFNLVAWLWAGIELRAATGGGVRRSVQQR
jgi:hypothetical protein